LFSLRVVPAAIPRIGARLGEFVGAHVRQRSHPLRMTCRRILRIATGIAVEVKEKRNLYGNAATASEAMPGTVSGIAALYVGVDRIVSIRNRIRHRSADLSQDRRSLVSSRSRSGVNHEAAVGIAGTHLAIGTGVFIGGLGVVRAVEA